MRKPRFISILLAGAMLFCQAIPVPAAAKDYTEGEFYSWKYRNYGDHIELEKLDYTGQVIINVPDEIDGLPVTKLDHNSIGAGIYIKEIHVPEGVTDIGYCAFMGAPELETVTLPSTLENLGDSVLKGCTALTEVTFAGGVKHIGSNAFAGCTSLTEIELPEGTEEIGGNAFLGCESLETITIADTVRSIGALDYSGTAVVGGTAWFNAQPNGVVYLGKFAVWYKGGRDTASDVTIADGTLGIASMAFLYQTKIDSLTLPDSLRYINDRAFPSEPGLTELHLPHDLESIDMTSFAYNAHLEAFTIDEDAPHFAVQDGLLYTKDLTELAAVPEGIRSVELSDKLSEIPDCAFQSCKWLESIALPDSVERIGAGAFSGCDALQTVKLPQSLKTIDTAAFAGCSGIEHIAFPEGLEMIGDSSFDDCFKLREAILPDTVTRLDINAFRNCRALRKVRLSAGLTELDSKELEIVYDPIPGYESGSEWIPTVQYDSIFGDCYNLKTLIFPKEITRVGAGTFVDMNIQDTWYTGTPEEWMLVMQNDQPNGYGTVHYGYDESSDLPGDLTLDGEFSVIDLVYLSRYLHNSYSISAQAFTNADLNGDGEVDVFDLGRMEQMLTA